VAGASRLPLVAILPYLGIASGSALVALAVGDPGRAAGYYYFCLVNGVAYVAVAAAVIALHVRENRPRPGAAWPLAGHATLTAVTAVPVAAAVALRGPEVAATLVPPGSLGSVTATLAAARAAPATQAWWALLGAALALPALWGLLRARVGRQP
jgi:hypothetical protein